MFHLLSPTTYLINLVILLILMNNSVMVTKNYSTFITFFTYYIFPLTFVLLSLYFYLPYREYREKISYGRFLYYYIVTIALLCSNTINAVKALLEGYLGFKTDFVRTPKHGDTVKMNLVLQKYYIKKFDSTVLVELCMLCYLLFNLIIKLFYSGTSPVFIVWIIIFSGGLIYFLFNQLKEHYALC
jgi:purine-cytosine permease-like protein